MSVAFWIALFVMLIGALGTVLPAIPGTPVIFAAALGYSFYEGFHKITPLVLAVLFFLMALTFIIDYFSGVLGAKKYGASRYGTWGSFLGGIVGVIFLNIPGLIIGPFVGAVTGEMIAGQSFKTALKVGLGTMAGLAGGAVLKLLFAVSMIAMFITSIF